VKRYDSVIKGGTIVDGTGRPRWFGDLAICDGVIERISTDIPADQAREVIDAEGLIVAPGGIDPHTHYDAQIHWDPYCTNSSWHGTTTFAVGNCGFGFMPCRADARERYMLLMENTEQVPLGAMRKALGWDWETFPEWVEHMKRLPKGVNIASYMPLNSLMMFVMGDAAAKSRGATRAELQTMRDLLNRAMDHGAIGFALSHLNQTNSHKDCDGTAMPTDEMQIEDAFSLAEVLRERDQGVIQCLCEVPGGASNRRTAEELARASRRPVLHNVVIGVDAIPDYHTNVLAWLDETERQGLNIYSQSLCYRLWNEFKVPDWDVWQTIPLFKTLTYAGDANAIARLAADPDFLERARKEYDPAPLHMVGGPLETYKLLNAHDATEFRDHQGKLVSEIARELGKPVTDVFFAIVARSCAQADFRATQSASQDLEKTVEILKHKRVIPGTSDGGAHVKFYSGGQYPTDNLMQLVREERRFTLEEMHYKLSGLPAYILGLNRRGTLVEGNAADLYVYDFERLGYDASAYQVAHDLPDGDWRRICRADGVKLVMVNGQVIHKGGICTGATPGRLLGNRGDADDSALRRPAAA
jgi:N-acyl-D-aspartate/D-glutamate deacylase